MRVVGPWDVSSVSSSALALNLDPAVVGVPKPDLREAVRGGSAPAGFHSTVTASKRAGRAIAAREAGSFDGLAKVLNVSEKPNPKLVVDGMLGRTARWLRIMGFDTLYDPRWNDGQLLAITRNEGRVLLTRDRELAGRAGVRSLLVKCLALEDRLRQVVQGLGLRVDRPFSRCLLCNRPLDAIPKEHVGERVPPRVFRSFDEFWICCTCGRIFWKGSHWERMRAVLLAEKLICPSDGSRV